MCTDKDMFFKVTDIQRVNIYAHSYKVSRTLSPYEYFLVFVNSGQVSFCRCGNSFKLSDGDFVLCQSGDTISYTSKKVAGADFYLLSFEAGLGASFLPLAPGVNKCTDKDCVNKILSLLLEEFILKKPFSDTNAAAILINLLCTLSRSVCNETPYQKAIYSLAKDINENFISGDIDISKYADKLNISKDRLSVIFREHFGCAPYKYQLMLKMKEATRLLESTDMSVGEISRYLGFSNPLYFSSAYKKQLGLSPTKRRKK